MDRKRLGIGFIGGGFISRFHIQSLISVRDVDVVGVMSKTKQSAEETAAIANDLNLGPAKAYDTITDMVADPKIDALWVCSPNFARINTFEEIVNAIQSGKGELIGVACEKPLGRNVREAKKGFRANQKRWVIRWLFRKPGFFTFNYKRKRNCLGSRCSYNGKTVFSSSS
jgi:predicted dehydrogenase